MWSQINSQIFYANYVCKCRSKELLSINFNSLIRIQCARCLRNERKTNIKCDNLSKVINQIFHFSQFYGTRSLME